MLTKVELPQGYKRLINKEKERKDVIQIIDEEGYLREVSFDDLTSHPTTLAGYGITDAYISNGTIYLGNQSITPAAVSSLGTAAYKNYATSVTQGSTDLPTSDAVFQAIGAAVSSALHYRGISSTIITDGGTETAVIGGQPLVVQSGDVVIYSGFEFLWENNVWNKLGDDTSFALKTVQITGDGIYITGGGDLTTSRSLGLSQAAIDALILASTALQSVAFSDLTSHPTTISGYGITDANISNGTITLGNNTITPLTSFTETDPTVPAWAKAASKPTYTLDEVADGSTRKLSNYLPLTGGTLTGALTLSNVDQTFDASATDRNIYYKASDNVSYRGIIFGKNGNLFIGYDGLDHSRTLYLDGFNEYLRFGSTRQYLMLLKSDGTIGLSGISAVLPATTNAADLGSSAKAFNNIYGKLDLSYVQNAPDLKAIEALTGTGLAKRTSDNTWELTDTADKAEELVTSTEDDAMFTSRQVPSVAVGDVCKITSVKGRSVVWNQLVDTGTTSVTIPSGHRYYAIINGVRSVGTSTGAAIAVTGGTDMVFDLTLMFGTTIAASMTAADFEAIYPLPYYDYNYGELVNNAASGVEMLDAGGTSLGTLSTPITEIVPADKPTLRLNQLVQNGDFSDSLVLWTNGGYSSAISISQGELIVEATITSGIWLHYAVRISANHKIYCRIKARSQAGIALTARLTGSVNTNSGLGNVGTAPVVLSTIFSATYDSSDFSIYSGSMTVGNKVYFDTIILIDLTEMYGSGNEPTSTAEVEELIGSGYIPYTTGENSPNSIFPVGMKSAGTAYDEWSGSTATKRIGVVDLGTLSWSYLSGRTFFYAALPGAKADGGSMCAKYTSGIKGNTFYDDTSQDKVIGITFTYISSVERVYVRDTAYTDAATFKSAMAGVYLYYEQATPETFTVDALPDTLVQFDAQGTQRRLPVDTSEEVAAPMVCDFQYGANIGDVIKSINNNTEEYRKKSDNNFTSINTGEIHCTGDIEANGNLTINDVIASAINASEEISIPTQMPSTIELGRVFMYYDEAEHQLCIRESDGTVKTIQFT